MENIILSVFLAICSLFDIRKKTVPLWLFFPWFVVSMVGMYIRNQNMKLSAVVISIVVSMLPGATLLVISFITQEQIGYGDGIGIIFMGLLAGVEKTIIMLMMAFFFSAIAVIVLWTLKKVGRKSRIPFYPFLWIASICNLCVMVLK